MANKLTSDRVTPQSVRPARDQFHTPRSLILPLLVFELILLFVGLVVMLRQAFFPSAGLAQVDYATPTLENFELVFTDPFYLGVMANTLYFGLGVTLLCMIIGFPIAYVIARYRRTGAILFNIVLITQFTSASIRALGWLIILGLNGPVNDFIQSVGLTDEPVKLTGNLIGAIIGTAQFSAPYLILVLAPALEDIRPSIEEAAYDLGASRPMTFFQVLVPLSSPALLGGALICFATSVGSFTTPALLGGESPVLPVVIMTQTLSALNYPLAATLSAILLFATAILVLAGTWTTRRLAKAIK